ncbi:MAG: slipin family protein, partial [Candidatus Zixiibacteriota bacterium]
LLSNRDKINQELQKIIDHQTEPWGIKVSVVEVKNVDLPPEMTRAIARQAEAERERRSKVIHAEGEFQASQKLAEAATVIAKAPSAILLRFLQTLTEISVNKGSTIVFPIPIELFKPFVKGLAAVGEEASE